MQGPSEDVSALFIVGLQEVFPAVPKDPLLLQNPGVARPPLLPEIKPDLRGQGVISAKSALRFIIVGSYEVGLPLCLIKPLGLC